MEGRERERGSDKREKPQRQKRVKDAVCPQDAHYRVTYFMMNWVHRLKSDKLTCIRGGTNCSWSSDRSEHVIELINMVIRMLSSNCITFKPDFILNLIWNHFLLQSHPVRERLLLLGMGETTRQKREIVRERGKEEERRRHRFPIPVASHIGRSRSLRPCLASQS